MKKNCLYSWVACLLVALGAILMVSCQSDAYYKASSVDAAREYLLANSKELSQMQREYIKYNKPVLLHENIFGEKSNAAGPFQICITWVVPGEADVFLVYGTGNFHMRNWYPIKIIKKQFIDKDRAKINAMKIAVAYIMNNMLFLSNETRNHIRFSTPKFAMTNFPLDRLGLLDKKDAFGKMKSAKNIAKEKALLKKQEQVALIYTTKNSANRVVVLGLSGIGLAGWTPVTGVEVTTEELNQHISANLLQ